MIVTDASAVIEVLLRTSIAQRIEKRLFDPGQTLHAPHLLDIEVAQVIRRCTALGEIPSERGFEALADLSDFPLRRYSHTVLLPRVWELRNSLTAYDAVYVALAEALGARLVTRDRRLGEAAKRHISVEVF